MSTYLKIAFLFWQLGLVDTFTMAKIFVNAAAQYGAVVLGASVGNFSNIGGEVFLEPFFGLATSYQYVKAAQTAVERHQRIITLAAFLSTSAASVVTADPATNAQLGGAISAKIAYMRAMLVRGGSRHGSHTVCKYFLMPSLKNFEIIANPIETPLLSPAQVKFQDNCKLITQNLFKEHTACRYVQRSAHKFPNYIISIAPIASTQLNTTIVISWTCLGIAIINSTIFVALYFFQRAEKKRYQISEIVIDVTASSNY